MGEMKTRELSRDAGRRSRRLDMKKALLFTILFTLPWPLVIAAAETTADKPSPEFSLTLRALSTEYGIDDVRRGAVEFRASIENRTDTPVTVAHPMICLPPDRREGESWHFSESHGKSEIVLTVQRPDGNTVVLRDGPHFFEPGNVPLFTVQPGEARDFSIGWFFLHSRMIWEDNRLAESLFLEKGSYRASLLFRNFFPQAAAYDPAMKRTDVIDVWTGELHSNEVTLEVR